MDIRIRFHGNLVVVWTNMLDWTVPVLDPWLVTSLLDAEALIILMSINTIINYVVNLLWLVLPHPYDFINILYIMYFVDLHQHILEIIIIYMLEMNQSDVFLVPVPKDWISEANLWAKMTLRSIYTSSTCFRDFRFYRVQQCQIRSNGCAHVL